MVHSFNFIKKSFLIIGCIFFLYCSLYANQLTGTLFEISSHQKKILYYWTLTLTAQGKPWKSVYTAPDGTIAATDEVIWEDGVFKGYLYQRDPIADKGKVILENQVLSYSHTIGDTQRKKQERYVPNYTVGPLVIVYIQTHWDELFHGEKQLIRYGVIDQVSSFGFEVSHQPDHIQNKTGLVVFRMRASNFFIRLFVRPTTFVFRYRDRALVSMTGRMLPVGIDKKKMYPIDAQLVIAKRNGGV